LVEDALNAGALSPTFRSTAFAVSKFAATVAPARMMFFIETSFRFYTLYRKIFLSHNGGA
jgi:hypothetical protein